MTRARMDGLILLLIGCAIFVLIGTALDRTSPDSMVDFKAQYYGTRCLIHGCDPYLESEVSRDYLASGIESHKEATLLSHRVGLNIYPPPTFFLMAPFALLPWAPAHLAWMLLNAAGLIMAAFLMWHLGASYAPVVAGALICLLLSGSGLLLGTGNAAGIAVSLCVIAVWCFFQQRFVPFGIVCMALSLAMKPHDAGVVWLYFLLAGGLFRRYALWALALTLALSVPATLWVGHVSPHWFAELHANLQTITSHGNTNDPGPDTIIGPNPSMLVNLQTVVSMLWDNPRIYNPASYLVCAPFLLLWIRTTLRGCSSQTEQRLGVAAIAVLGLLPLYHRQYDTRLLLLTVPICAQLWAEGGRIGRLSLLLTAAAALFTSDISLRILAIVVDPWLESTHSVLGKLSALWAARPASFILLAVGIFYWWVYMRRTASLGAPADAAIVET